MLSRSSATPTPSLRHAQPSNVESAGVAHVAAG
jgi:hypothetical protein